MANAGLFTMGGTFTRTLTIDHLQVPSTQTDFPVLVRFTDDTFKTVANGGHVQTTNAFTFSSDSLGVSLLKWEVERYNASTGEIVAWVKIASVSSVSDTVFYLRYGITITTDQSDPTNVWTSSFLGVYHLKDGTTLSVADSLNSNNGTNHSVTATEGQIDGAGSFVSASSQYVDLGTGINPLGITFSAWVNATSFPNAYNGVLVRGLSGTNGAGLYVKSTGKLACFAIIGGPTNLNYDGTGSNTLSSGTAYYLALTFERTTGVLTGYVNGSSDGTNAFGGSIDLIQTATNTAIGRDIGQAAFNWNGWIDEGRVASVARTANWLTCEYNNQKTSQTFVALGSET